MVMTVQPFSVKGAFVFHTDFGMSHGLGHQIPFKVCFIRDLFAKASLIQTTLIKNSTSRENACFDNFFGRASMELGH